MQRLLRITMVQLFKITKCFILSIFLFGCATYGYYFSKPVEGDKSYKFYPNGIVFIKLENIDLFLLPKNNSVFEAGAVISPVPVVIGKDSSDEFHYSSEYFDVEVVLHSKKEGFLFNPKEINLTLENGDTLQPIQYLVREGQAYWPLRKEPHNLLYYNPDDPNWTKEDKVWFESNYFHLTKDKEMWGIGFIVRFNTNTPRPGTSFSIEMKGLKRFDQRIFIPKIQYKDKSRYNWTFN